MPASKAQIEANNRYNLKAYDRIDLRVKKGTRDAWKAAAEKAGKSLAHFISDAVEHEIENECL